MVFSVTETTQNHLSWVQIHGPTMLCMEMKHRARKIGDIYLNIHQVSIRFVIHKYDE